MKVWKTEIQQKCKHGAFLLAVLLARIMQVLQSAETRKAKLVEKLDQPVRSSSYGTEWGTGVPTLCFQFCQAPALALDRTPDLYVPWFSLLNSKPYRILAICSGAVLLILNLSFSCGYQLPSSVTVNKHKW